MNIIGTHDTDRILTVLGDESYHELSNAKLSCHVMKDDEREKAKKLLKMASVIQYTVYGVPSLYYGDEAGLEGYHDPFCRRPYPWGREDAKLMQHYRTLGALRTKYKDVFARGYFKLLSCEDGVIAYSRKDAENELVIIANSTGCTKEYSLRGNWTNVITGKPYKGSVPSVGFVILGKERG